MKHRLVAVVAAATLSLGLAGCNFITPQATTVEYDAADGVSGSTGVVQVRNALIVVEDDMANIVVTFVNNGPETTLTVTAGTESTQVMLDEGLNAFGFPDGQQIVVPLEDVIPGSLFDVSFKADGADAVALELQVFSTESAGYETLAPQVPETTFTPEEPEVDPQPSVINPVDPTLTPTPEPTEEG